MKNNPKTPNKKRRKTILTAIIAVIAVIIVAGAVFWIYTQKNLDKLAGMEIADVNLEKVANGVFIGEYGVFPVSASVAVSVRNHVITSIEIISHYNGRGEAAEVLPEIVIEKQSLMLDAISGATYSSKVILKAIENALTSAIN